MKKFAEKLDASEERRERRPRKETSNEPKEWVSGSSSATLGDLFKNLNLQLDDEASAEAAPAESAEEAPKKKVTRKKKTEEAPAEETPAE